MARWWIGLLLLLNVALLAWNMGALAPWGLAPGQGQSGPSVTLAIQAAPAEAASAASAATPAAPPKAPASAPRPKPAPAAAESESN